MQAAGEIVPEALAKPPELNEGLELYFDAFSILDTERSHQFDFTRIPWSSIQRYAEVYRLDDEQREDLVFYIMRMDEAHISRLTKKREQDGNFSRSSRTPNGKGAGVGSSRKH